MEKYIQTMQNADREAGIITDRANRYARDIAEVNESTVYTDEYKERQRQQITEAYTAAIVPLCEECAATIDQAAEEAAEAIKKIDLSDPADLNAALEIIRAGNVKRETLEALEDVFRGRRQHQLIINTALEHYKLGELPVYDPVPSMREAAAAIGKVATFTNVPDIFRELLKAQRSFNKFYGDAGADCNAAWNLPIDAIRERDLREVMGLL